MKISKNLVSTSEKKRKIIFWSVRILLIILLLIEIPSNRTAIQIIYFIVFLLSFAPSIVKRMVSIKLPFPIEILYLSSLLITVLGEKIFSGWLVQFVLGIFFGIIGFLLMYTLYYNSRMRSSILLVTLFSFTFSVASGTIWLMCFYILSVLNLKIYDLNSYFMSIALLFTILGAGIISTLEYFYLQYGEGKIFHKLINAFMRKNPTFFEEKDLSKDVIKKIIQQGEHEQLEFKSSLRKNLHTNKVDKKIEHAVLKTITAFLNSDGGTLLVGVADDGSVLGIDHDGFTSTDKFYQHYTNLVQNHIGNEHLPLIKSRLIPIDDAHILKIDCRQSNKAVFLEKENDQLFYVRIGPASVQLKGKKLLEYVHKKF